jgi:hypothetical protein
MSQTVSAATVALLKQLDHEALATCLYAACDLALRASRGNMPVPPQTMTADDLVRQIVSDMPARATRAVPAEPVAPAAPAATPL